MRFVFYHLGLTTLFMNPTNLWKIQIIFVIRCILQQLRYANRPIFIFLTMVRFEQPNLCWHQTRSSKSWISLLGMWLPLFWKTGIRVGEEWNANGECGRNPTGINRVFRVRLFWVKMISGNHFHHFPHVWLSRKISFSVTAKHTENGENDFLKSFSPKTNAP